MGGECCRSSRVVGTLLMLYLPGTIMHVLGMGEDAGVMLVIELTTRESARFGTYLVLYLSGWTTLAFLVSLLQCFG